MGELLKGKVLFPGTDCILHRTPPQVSPEGDAASFKSKEQMFVCYDCVLVTVNPDWSLTP